MKNYDLVVIGGGPAGYESALEAVKKYGMQVAIVEKNALGGTCLNEGCIPTKTLIHSAELYDEVRKHGDTLGLTGFENLSYSLEKLQCRKNEVISQLVQGIQSLMKANKIDVYEGTGTLLDAHTVSISLNTGEETTIHTDYVLIATGSVPAVPRIEGIDLPGVMASDELLNISKPFESLTIIGGGVIGCEFASLFSALGIQVTMIEAQDRIIPNMDKEISQSLKMMMKKSGGIDIHNNALVSKIAQNGDQLTCHFKEKETENQVTSDLILISIGRKACIADIIGENSSEEIRHLEIEKGNIIVNDCFKTSVDNIYAVGDVIGGVQLAHVATAEGRCAVAYMNGKIPSINLDAIPSCIYTTPEIASVGMSAEQAKALGLSVISQKYSMGANGKTVLSLRGRGYIKVIALQENHQVIGAQMLCARATDMITQFSQAITAGLTIEDMARVIYPHPSFSEGIGETVK